MSRFVRVVGVALVALGWPHLALGVTCKISGKDFGDAAATTAPPVIVSSTGTGRCDFADNNAIMAIALDSDQTCVAKFFPGLNLARPWTFSDIAVDGHGFVIDKQPMPDDRALELQLSVTAPAHRTRAATVMSIEMYGDKDKCPRKPPITGR